MCTVLSPLGVQSWLWKFTKGYHHLTAVSQVLRRALSALPHPFPVIPPLPERGYGAEDGNLEWPFFQSQ